MPTTQYIIVNTRDPYLRQMARFAVEAARRNAPGWYGFARYLNDWDVQRYGIVILRAYAYADAGGTAYLLRVRVRAFRRCIGGFAVTIYDANNAGLWSVVDYGQPLGCRASVGLFGLFG
jgi:hypothetical protein